MRRDNECQSELVGVHQLAHVVVLDVDVPHPRGAASRYSDGRLAVAADSGGRVQWLAQHQA